jgi:alpha-galactosidase
MKLKFILLSLVLLFVKSTYSQIDKQYLPTGHELAFPHEIAQRCFGIKKAEGNINQIEQSYGHINFNKSYINQQICIGNKKYEHGIGVHATSSILVNLPKPASRFYAEVGLDNNSQTNGKALYKVIFSIETNKKIIWESIPLAVGDQPQMADVPLSGNTEFYLKVKSAGPRVNLCHADWADASVVYGNDEKVYLDKYMGKITSLNELPLSFILDGKSSREFLNTWNFSFSDSAAADRIIHKIKWIKPDNTFEVRCLLTEFINHPAVEWKLFFKNAGPKNSPVLEKIMSLDAVISEPVQLYPNQSPYSPVFVQCNKGSNNSRYDFMPFTQMLDLEQTYPIKSHAGRSSESFLPFWNFEYHGCGIITALGWSGDWQADFSYPKSNQAIMKAGMANVSLYLKPGEEISSPSVCLLYWEGKEALRGNNLFRRYMRDAVAPKWNGKEPVTLAMSGGSSALETVNERNQLDYISKIAGSGAEVYWLDAGWYAGPKGGSWADCRGNWFPDPIKFPNGMKILADAAHNSGMKFLLWFDPEAVSPGTEISEKHPEWVIRRNPNETGLLNLGNPDALKYITDLISGNLINWNVDVYRNDFNIDPGPMWKMADEPGRTGITEIRYVEGLYCFWDQLLKRNPGLLIDNCASGGRRIDYETCKRSVPLWRSDYECDVLPDLYEASQNQTYGLGYYLPFNSTGQGVTFNQYKDRSMATASVVFSIGTSKPEDLAIVPIDKLKQVWNDMKSYNYLMPCDFYPLTEFSMNDDAWMVLQYDSPERGEGCVICFRRMNAPFAEAEFKLRKIDPQATYKLMNINDGTGITVKGNQLEKLTVRLNQLESNIFKYVKVINQ